MLPADRNRAHRIELWSINTPLQSQLMRGAKIAVAIYPRSCDPYGLHGAHAAWFSITAATSSAQAGLTLLLWTRIGCSICENNKRHFLPYHRNFGLCGTVERIGKHSLLISPFDRYLLIITLGFEGNVNTAGSKTDDNPYPQGVCLWIQGEVQSNTCYRHGWLWLRARRD